MTPQGDLREAVREADYVVEAVLEDLPLKQKLFGEIEALGAARHDPRQQHLGHPDHADHGRLKRRERALGTHWWNPPYLVPLVEVIGTEWTSRRRDRLDDRACMRTSARRRCT